jgi:hypothetical protein
VTALAGKKLNHLVKEARRRRIIKTDGLVTHVGWKKDTRIGGEYAPWVDATCSKHLTRDECVITLEHVPAEVYWRAVCRNHTCCRDMLPCSGLLALYPNTCVEGDVHPRWLLTTHNGEHDTNLPCHGYLGLLVSAGRADKFGCTPIERRTVGDLVDSMRQTILYEEFESDSEMETDDSAFDFGPDLLSRAPAATHTVQRSEMLTAANTAIRFAGDSPENRQFVIDEFIKVGEALRSRNETSVPNATVQQRSILRSPSNKSAKIG